MNGAEARAGSRRLSQHLGIVEMNVDSYRFATAQSRPRRKRQLAWALETQKEEEKDEEGEEDEEEEEGGEES